MFELYVDGVLMLNDHEVLPFDPMSNLVSLDFIRNGLIHQGLWVQQLEISRISEPPTLLITAIGLLACALTSRNNSIYIKGLPQPSNTR